MFRLITLHKDATESGLIIGGKMPLPRRVYLLSGAPDCAPLVLIIRSNDPTRVSTKPTAVAELTDYHSPNRSNDALET